MTDYDQVFRENAAYFGGQPAPIVQQFAPRLPAGGRILDIGIGQGRNSLPLAAAGFKVTGIDTSSVAIATVRDRAARDNLEIDLWHGSFMGYQPPAAGFQGVLCLGLLQDLDRSRGASLLYRLREWTRPGGLVFLTAWHVDDPAYPLVSQTWERTGLHSFRSRTGDSRTFLARGEILDLMQGWEVIHHWEGLGKEHRHGEGQIEQHGNVEFVGKRWNDRQRRRSRRRRGEATVFGGP